MLLYISNTHAYDNVATKPSISTAICNFCCFFFILLDFIIAIPNAIGIHCYKSREFKHLYIITVTIHKMKSLTLVLLNKLRCHAHF